MSNFLSLKNESERFNNRPYYRGVWEAIKTTNDRLIPFQTNTEGDELVIKQVVNGVETDVSAQFIGLTTTYDRLKTYNGEPISCSSDYLQTGRSYFKINGRFTEDFDILELGTPQSGGVYTDLDGNIYESVIIGDLEWLRQNWRCTQYADGSAIPNITADLDWANDTLGAYCVYNNDNKYSSDYGYLYNYCAITNTKGLISLKRGNAPEYGWRVPYQTDFTNLLDAVGGATTAGSYLKKMGYIPYSGDSKDDYRLSLYPSGYRQENGTYSGTILSSNIASQTLRISDPDVRYNAYNYMIATYLHQHISATTDTFEYGVCGHSVRGCRSIDANLGYLKISVSSDIDFGGTYYKGGFVQSLWKEGVVEKGQGAKIEVIGDERNGKIVKEKIITASKYMVKLKVTEAEYAAMVQALPGEWTILDPSGKLYYCYNLEISDPDWYNGNGIVTLTFNDNINTYAQNNEDI